MMISESFLNGFTSAFLGRRNDYALQREDGRYMRVGAPLTLDVIRRHLQGLHTVGTYVINEQGLCSYAVFDADMSDGLTVLSDLQTRLNHVGIASYLEASRRGGHLWVFLETDAAPATVRRWLLPLCPVGVEFYPKQDTTSGYGSLIRLPFGVHRLSGSHYDFVSIAHGLATLPIVHLKPERTDWLARLSRVAVPADTTNAAPSGKAQTSTNTIVNKQAAVSLNSLSSSISSWCATQDPYQLIGRSVRLDHRGIGCCPFGEHHQQGKDTRSSFRVYPPSTSGNCWYCYVWQRGGNVFNFLSLYHNIDARTLWSRIRAGESF